MSPIINLLMSAIAIFVAGQVLPGIKIENFITAVVVAVVLAVVNILVKPILLVLTLPFNILTLGLFTFVLNGLLILLASSLVAGFSVANIWWAILFSLIVSIITSVLHGLTK